MVALPVLSSTLITVASLNEPLAALTLSPALICAGAAGLTSTEGAAGVVCAGVALAGGLAFAGVSFELESQAATVRARNATARIFLINMFSSLYEFIKLGVPA